MTSSALLRRGQRDRGATLVEYALMLTLVAVVCTTAIRGLGNKSSDSFADAHAGISAAATTARGGGDGGEGAGGGDGGAGGGDGGATTLAPSTTATTTTVPAPTTTLTQTWIELSNPTTAQPTSSTWTATSRLSVLSTSAAGVPGAVVTMKVRSLKNGTWSETTVNVTTAANGTVSYTTPPQQWSAPNVVTQVELVVTAVQLPAGYTFNGSMPTVTANKP